MNIFLEEDQLEEIKPLEPTEDKGVVINPTVGERGEGKTELQKEIVALDTLEIGPSAAALISGVPASSASKYSQGKDMAPETRNTILSIKNDIKDLAVTKLMDTLNLLDPSDMDKPRDKIALLTAVSNLVDKIENKEKGDDGKPTVHLHLYGPKQKEVKDYATIDV